MVDGWLVGGSGGMVGYVGGDVGFGWSGVSRVVGDQLLS